MPAQMLLDDHLAGILIHFDVDHDAGVSVVAFIGDAGDAAAGDYSGLGIVGIWRRTRFPFRGFGGGLEHSDQARVAQVAHAEFHGIGFDVRCHFIHETFMREGILQTRGRTQRAGPEGRQHVVDDHALAFHGSGALGDSVDVPHHVGRNSVAAIVVALRLLGGPGCEGRGLIADEHSRDHVAGSRRAGAVA